jgi:hypothetical protein
VTTEGWMSMESNGKPPNMRPSHDPNRKEVLIISGMQIEGQLKHLKLFEMKRDPQKRIISQKEFVMSKHES